MQTLRDGDIGDKRWYMLSTTNVIDAILSTWQLLKFYHLLTHLLNIFKSILFICAEVIIHSIVKNQDIRLFGNLKEIIPYTIICFFIANIALCEFPFVSGFYSNFLCRQLRHLVCV